MLGIDDPAILLAYGLTFGLTIACVIYGLLFRDEGCE